MRAQLKLLEPGALQSGGMLGAFGGGLSCTLAALGDELPEGVHVCAGDDLVACAGEEEHGRCGGDEGYL